HSFTLSLSLTYSSTHLLLYSFPTRRLPILAVVVHVAEIGAHGHVDFVQANFDGHVFESPIAQIAVQLECNGTFKDVTVEVGLNKDRKSTRLNSSHLVISYAVFCLKKKK